MSADHPSTPLKHLWTTAREYLTHWFTAGVIVTLTGFTPDHWVANFFHAVKLDDIRDSLPAADYRLMVVGVGVIVSTFAVIFQIGRTQKQQLAALAAKPAITVAAHPAAASHVNDIDDMAHKPSVAVLPFVNLSSDPEQEYFADGMTEDIITGLSCDSRLFVISRNSAFVYKGKPVDSRTVGKELGVRYVLEGSLRPANDKLRINLQLIDTANGAHIWADRIDRPKSELFDVMDEVVDGIVMALCANLGAAESDRAKRQRPEDIQAWALCVQAEFLTAVQASPEAVQKAEGLARRAAEIEPGYAVCWALLAYLTVMRIAWGLSAGLKKDSEEALALIGKALILAPNDAVVLGYCGIASIWAGQTGQAINYLERSLAINPNNSFVRYAYGQALNNDASPVEGIAQLQLFIRRSPKDPYIGRAYFYLCWCYQQLGEFQQMEQAALNVIKHLPGFGWGYMALAMSLAAQGRDAEIAQPMQKFREFAPSLTGQKVEDFWRHILRKPGHAEKLVRLTRQVFGD